MTRVPAGIKASNPLDGTIGGSPRSAMKTFYPGASFGAGGPFYE